MDAKNISIIQHITTHSEIFPISVFNMFLKLLTIFGYVSFYVPLIVAPIGIVLNILIIIIYSNFSLETKNTTRLYYISIAISELGTLRFEDVWFGLFGIGWDFVFNDQNPLGYLDSSSLSSPYWIPLFKGKGLKTSVTNYRPITITDSISKIFERVIVSIINKDYSKLISNNQHGFKARYSTLSNLLNTYSIILNSIDSSEPIDLISIDLSKAFDKMDHFLLINTLFKEGFDLRIVRVIDNFLTNRYQIVKNR